MMALCRMSAGEKTYQLVDKTHYHLAMSGQIDQRHLLNKCLVIDLRRWPGSESGLSDDPSAAADEDGFAVFKAWLSVNLESYWSTALLSALRRLTLVGLLRPCLLLVTAAPGHLDVIRTAWCQRTLRAPPGYTVAMLGEAHGYNVTPVAPGHFTSLPEAICYVIQTLNSSRTAGKVTLDDVCGNLRRHFPHLELPDRAVVFSTLGRLVRERKIYHTRQGYCIVTPETYQQQLAAEMERDAVRAGRLVFRMVQTDLADIILGGSDSDRVIHARPLQSETLAPPIGMGVFGRRHSLKLSANQREEYFRRASSMRYPSGGSLLRPAAPRQSYTDETSTNAEYSVLERPSLFSKLLRLAVPRRQLATFSAQFPPPEWTNGDVTHLHSVGTQTAPRRTHRSDRSPKLMRSRRHKHRRPVNGSMDHLAEPAETSAPIAELQVAPRSSTLPRRTKLYEFLADAATDDGLKSSVQPSRQRRQSPRTRADALKSPEQAHHTVKGKDAHGSVVTMDSGVGRSGVSAERGNSSPNHAEGLAQRHVRERLEARARHSSSRTSSGSSLERSDNSPATSLERGAKLELPRPSRDGRREPAARDQWDKSVSSNGVGGVAEPCSRIAGVVGASSGLEMKRGDAVTANHAGMPRASPKHCRSSRGAGCSPADSASPVEGTDPQIGAQPSTVLPSRRREHKSPRRVVRDSKLHSVDSSRDSKLGSPSRKDDRSKSSNAAPSPKTSKTNGEDVAQAASHRQRRIVPDLKRDIPNSREKQAQGEAGENRDVHRVGGANDGNRPGYSRRPEDEPVYQNIGILAMKDSPARVNSDTFTKKPREVAPSPKVRPDRNVPSPNTREGSDASLPKTRDHLAGSSPKTHGNRATSSPKVRRDRSDATETNDVTQPSSDITQTLPDASDLHRAQRKRKDQNTRVLRGSERKQMNNEKVLEVTSPTRPEKLSVKNIFHEISVPAKVPPKSLMDGIPPEPRPSRPLTYQDLVKTPPAKMADVALSATKMADVASPATKMADVASPANKMAGVTPASSVETPPESEKRRPGSRSDTSLRTYPSLSSLNLNFKSLAAQRLIHGTSANSIDTLVEVNLAAERRRSGGSIETTLLGIL